MSLGGQTRWTGWWPWERAGWAAGFAAGGIVLLSLWVFSTSTDIVAALAARRPKPT